MGVRPGRLAAAPAAALALAALALAPGGRGLAQGWTGTGHAVVVGISDYPGTADDLDWCDDDAREFRETLLSDPAHWSAGNVRILLDAEATYDAINQAISEEFAEATGPEDVCLFYFSGHGTRVADTPPLDEAPGDDYDEALFVYGPPSVILDDDLEAWFWAHNTKRICAIFDICRAGGMAKSVDASSDLWNAGLASDVLKAFEPVASAPDVGPAAFAAGPGFADSRAAAPRTRDVEDSGQTGIVMLMACEDVELSEEDPVLRNGVFSFYVIEALRRAASDADESGCVSAEEVYSYAFPLVVEWNPDQTPELYDTDAGWEMDVITAADRPLDTIVTEKDFPFGGDGCAAGRGGGAPWAGLAALGLVAVALASRRKRVLAALCLTVALALSAGCGGGAPSRGESEGRFAARTGLVSPFDEENAPYSCAPQVGVSYRGPLPWGWTELEFGADAFVIDGDGYDVQATVLCLRADLVFSGDAAARPWVGYLNAGPRLLLGGVTTYWGSGFDGAWGVGLAGGVRRAESGADFRVSLDWLPASGNIEGLFGLTAGWSF